MAFPRLDYRTAVDGMRRLHRKGIYCRKGKSNHSIRNGPGGHMPVLLRAAGFFAVSVLLAGTPARAQDAYPSKPVRIIVPFAPAGPADIIARLMAQKLTEEFGKQFYVENHAGAGGNIGAGVAARAPADGTSLMLDRKSVV